MCRRKAYVWCVVQPLPRHASQGCTVGAVSISAKRIGGFASAGLLHLLAETARRVAECDTCALCRQLEPYRNFMQRMALRFRIDVLRRALRRTIAARADFLTPDESRTEQNPATGAQRGSRPHLYLSLCYRTRLLQGAGRGASYRTFHGVIRISLDFVALVG